jgi:hypothetical protein
VKVLHRVICILPALALPSWTRGSGPELSSRGTSVQLTATLDESLSLVTTTPLVQFRLRPRAVAQADRTVMVETRWNLDASRARVVVTAFFRDPAGALRCDDQNAEAIPGAEVHARVASGTARSFTSFAAETANRRPGSVELLRQELRPGVGNRGSRSDPLELEIDLSSVSRLESGDYRGDLTLMAEAY